MREPFENVVARHGPTVLRVCRAVVGPVEAEDVWSETFLAAMRHYPQLPETANVQAWLVTIAHRKAIDETRRAARRAIPLDHLPESPSTRGQPGADDDSAALYAALAALPDKQRSAVAYHHLAGLPHAEVAEVLGGTVAAARRASADGMAALRRHFAVEATSGPRSEGQSS